MHKNNSKKTEIYKKLSDYYRNDHFIIDIFHNNYYNKIYNSNAIY
jgi:hypothetical protein